MVGVVSRTMLFLFNTDSTRQIAELRGGTDIPSATCVLALIPDGMIDRRDAVVRVLKDSLLMKRKSSRKILESMCGQPGPDDGLDPRAFFRPACDRRDSRKDWQVCRQVFETLNSVLSGETGDDVLRSLLVCEVVPAPDATRLLVSVQSLDRTEGSAPAVILERLQQATGRLRAEVARSISRRKVPELVFRVIPHGLSDPGHEGEQQ